MGERMAALIQFAQQRHAAGIKPPVPGKVAEATLSHLVEMGRIQRLINHGLARIRQKELPAALDNAAIRN